jgi:hypothetical protein
MPSSPQWSLSFSFRDQSFASIFSYLHACYMPRPSHPLWFDHENNIWWSVVQILKTLIKRSPPVCSHLRPLRFRCSPQLLFPSSCSRNYTLNVRDQVSHSYRTTSEIQKMWGTGRLFRLALRLPRGPLKLCDLIASCLSADPSQTLPTQREGQIELCRYSEKRLMAQSSQLVRIDAMEFRSQ